jgi:hypothetical protein
MGTLSVLLLVGGLAFYYEGYPAAQSVRATSSATRYKPMGVENPQIHWDRLAESQQAEYQTTGRDIFNWQLPPPPPPHIPVPKPEEVKAPEPPPTPPPPPPPPPPPKLPLKFFGVSGRRAFLTDGDAVFIAAEGDTVLGRYRIIKITSVSLQFEEISSGRSASKAIEDQDPSK